MTLPQKQINGLKQEMGFGSRLAIAQKMRRVLLKPYEKLAFPASNTSTKDRAALAKASRNYVVFDDKLIDIMRKYGIVGAAPLAALGISAQPQQTPEM